MKKMTMICMAALLVTAMSCKKEKVENTAVGAGFRATLEAHAGDSKTHLDGLSVKWDLGDAVTVVNANDVAKTFVISAIHDDYSDLVPAEGEGVTDAFYKPNYRRIIRLPFTMQAKFPCLRRRIMQPVPLAKALTRWRPMPLTRTLISRTSAACWPFSSRATAR